MIQKEYVIKIVVCVCAVLFVVILASLIGVSCERQKEKEEFTEALNACDAERVNYGFELASCQSALLKAKDAARDALNTSQAIFIQEKTNAEKIQNKNASIIQSVKDNASVWSNSNLPTCVCDAVNAMQ